MALHTDTYVVDGHMIWGATARIVSDLLERVGGMLGADNRVSTRRLSV
jgi:hypothetical protein